MTAIIIFIFQTMGHFIEVALNLKFELFGNEVSMMSISIGLLLIIAAVQFFRLFVPSETIGLSNIGRGRNENRKDMKQQRRELKAKEQGGRHVKVTGPRHTRQYFNSLRRGGKNE